MFTGVPKHHFYVGSFVWQWAASSSQSSAVASPCHLTLLPLLQGLAAPLAPSITSMMVSGFAESQIITVCCDYILRYGCKIDSWVWVLLELEGGGTQGLILNYSVPSGSQVSGSWTWIFPRLWGGIFLGSGAITGLWASQLVKTYFADEKTLL